MSFKQKLDIHDAMMTLHKRFMDTASSLKTGVSQETDEGKKLLRGIDDLIGTMKSMAQLVDKALDVESV